MRMTWHRCERSPPSRRSSLLQRTPPKAAQTKRRRPRAGDRFKTASAKGDGIRWPRRTFRAHSARNARRTPNPVSRSTPTLRAAWSGRRDSNPRPTAWKAVTLPLSYSRAPAWGGSGGGGWIRTTVGLCPTDLQSVAFDRSATPPATSPWSRHPDSNRGPTAYKAVALPLSYAGPRLRGAWRHGDAGVYARPSGLTRRWRTAS